MDVLRKYTEIDSPNRFWNGTDTFPRIANLAVKFHSLWVHMLYAMQVVHLLSAQLLGSDRRIGCHIGHSDRHIGHSARRTDHSDRRIGHSDRRTDHSDRRIGHHTVHQVGHSDCQIGCFGRVGFHRAMEERHRMAWRPQVKSYLRNEQTQIDGNYHPWMSSRLWDRGINPFAKNNIRTLEMLHDVTVFWRPRSHGEPCAQRFAQLYLEACQYCKHSTMLLHVAQKNWKHWLARSIQIRQPSQISHWRNQCLPSPWRTSQSISKPYIHHVKFIKRLTVTVLSIVISVLWQAKTRTDSKSPSCLYHLNHRHWSHSCCSCFQDHPCHQGHCRQGRRDHHRVAHRTPTLPPNQMVNPGESGCPHHLEPIYNIYIYICDICIYL